MGKRQQRRGGRTTPKGSRPPAHGDRMAARPPLVDDAARCLASGSPFSLLALASGLIEATTPRPSDVWMRGGARPDGPAAFESFAVSGWPELAALATAVAALHPDELLARRLRSLVDADLLRHAPRWLSTMGELVVTDATVQRDVLGDGENVTVSWRWPGRQAATAVVFVDHNLGTVVKDAFVVDEDAAGLAAILAAHGDPRIATMPIAPADARARITEAIELGERMVPPIDNETWPACRPMVEWVLRHLPDGGTGYVRPDWSDTDRERLVAEFTTSAHGKVARLSPATVRDLAAPLVWFACDDGPGDPLRWSPVSVEIVLADWYPRKVFGLPAADLRRLPDVLVGLVRFAHGRTGVAPELTEATIAAVEEWRADFLTAIARPDRSPRDNVVRLASVGAGSPDDLGFDPGFDDPGFDDDERDRESRFVAGLDDDASLEETVDALEAELIRLVGGRDAYETLDDAPLEDVPLDLSRIPAELVDQTVATAELLDRWATDLFDPEVRTIARRVLTAVVAADPAVYRRSARVDAFAAGILAFLLRRLTDRLTHVERRRTPWSASSQQDIAAVAGVSATTLGARARTIGNVLARADIDWPAILHSTQRREILETRTLISDWRNAAG